jgi:hypothetical protein
MAKKVKPKMNMLPEVKVTATRLTKPATKTALYPKGEVRNSQIDSIGRANPALSRMIGKPDAKPGYRPQYNVVQSDIIKQAIKPKPLPKGQMLAGRKPKK